MPSESKTLDRRVLRVRDAGELRMTPSQAMVVNTVRGLFRTRYSLSPLPIRFYRFCKQDAPPTQREGRPGNMGQALLFRPSAAYPVKSRFRFWNSCSSISPRA